MGRQAGQEIADHSVAGIEQRHYDLFPFVRSLFQGRRGECRWRCYFDSQCRFFEWLFASEEEKRDEASYDRDSNYTENRPDRLITATDDRCIRGHVLNPRWTPNAVVMGLLLRDIIGETLVPDQPSNVQMVR